MCDGIDNCPDNINFGQWDNDSDGVGNACDNCVQIYNPNQEDFNSDEIGDSCDGSIDLDEKQVFKKLITTIDVLGRENELCHLPQMKSPHILPDVLDKDEIESIKNDTN